MSNTRDKAEAVRPKYAHSTDCDSVDLFGPNLEPSEKPCNCYVKCIADLESKLEAASVRWAKDGSRIEELETKLAAAEKARETLAYNSSDLVDEIVKLRAENARLAKALELIARYIGDNRTSREVHILGTIDRVLAFRKEKP